MFSNHEALKCKGCEKAFMGRKPPSDVDIYCPECRDATKFKVLNEGDEFPASTLEEFTSGGGENG